MVLLNRDDQHALSASLDEIDGWRETVHLLSSPANAEHLRRSMAEADAGKIVSPDLIEP